MRATARLTRTVESDRDPLSPQAGHERKGAGAKLAAAGATARSLAGATILQIVPALRDDPAGQAALGIARTLVQAGARAVIAGEDGPLAGDFQSIGAEWLAMPNDTIDPLRIGRNARRIEQMIAAERIDIVHAQSAGAAWSALAATDRLPVFLVTSFPDRPAPQFFSHRVFRTSLARGDRVIAPSSYVARAMIERYDIPGERISVIPRAVDTAAFDPATVSGERTAALRRAWGIEPHIRVVLVPGRIASWNGQMTMIDAARLLAGVDSNFIVVFAGDDRVQPRYTRALRNRARTQDIDAHCRLIGRCADMPAAIAASDVVVVPSLAPPLTGRAAAETQAMGRPVVVSTVGVLPENVLCPPRMPEELRTGWSVPPGDAGELARAIGAALSLDTTAYEALGARARQFAEFMFSPQSVAEAIRAVYTSLLARDA